MVLDKSSQRFPLCPRQVLIVGICDLQRFCPGNLVLGEMHIHLISIKVGVIGIAVYIIYSESLFAW